MLALLLACPALIRAGTQLRFGWRPGLELRYRLTIQGKNSVGLGERTQASTLSTRLHLTQRVLAVGKDGVARVLTRVASGRTRRDKQDSKVLPPRQGTMRMDPRGRILDGSLLEQGPSPLQLIFPDRPLEIGDSWFNSLPPSQEIPVPIKIRYTLTGRQESMGLECIRIGLVIEGARASALEGPMELGFQARGEILFAPREGILVSSDVHSDLGLSWKLPSGEEEQAVHSRSSFDMLLEYRP